MLTNRPLSSAQVESACRFAAVHDFAAVMVPICLMPLARLTLGQHSAVKLIAVVDAPFGQSAQREKVSASSHLGSLDGVSQVAVALNHTAMLDGRLDDVRGELRACARVSRFPLCAMFELSLLDQPAQRRELALSLSQSVVEWLQPHIGLRKDGRVNLTTLEDVRLLREEAPHVKIRAYCGPLAEWSLAMRLAEVADNVAVDWRPAFAA
jgi:deoxyribose-phosphate aldolase